MSLILIYEAIKQFYYLKKIKWGCTTLVHITWLGVEKLTLTILVEFMIINLLKDDWNLIEGFSFVKIITVYMINCVYIHET